MLEYVSESEEATERIGQRLATSLRPGDVLLLTGNLGAGKTAFVRGLTLGLGSDPDDVSSPTFTLVQEYRGTGLALHHVDLYRLAPLTIDTLGLDEEAVVQGVLAIEWPDRLTHEVADAIAVTIEIVDDVTRRITVLFPAKELQREYEAHHQPDR